MARNIRNRNIRFYEEKEADRRAWEILHSEEIRTFSSQNDFIILTVNDFYDRHLAISDDPYLEIREKEDAFADRIVEKVGKKVLGNLSQLIGIYLLQQNMLAAGHNLQTEGCLQGNGGREALNSGDGILQNDGGAEEPEENEFLDFSFGG